ncbi:unnamed protein product, partial [Meganyctiphanes norvegica]
MAISLASYLTLGVGLVKKNYNSSLISGILHLSSLKVRIPNFEWKVSIYGLTVFNGGVLSITPQFSCYQETRRDIHLNLIFKEMKAENILTRRSRSGKISMLKFFTSNENPQMVLSFVDYRRFGRWVVNGSWGKDRGPDPMWDYSAFREKIMNNLDAPVFKRPICEAMLDQAYFNGIGNYLRAEILFR